MLEGAHRIENYQALADYQNDIICEMRRKINTRLSELSPDDQRNNSEIDFLTTQKLNLAGMESLYKDVQKRLINGSNEYLLKLLWRKMGSPIVEGTVTGFAALNTIQSIAAGGSEVTFQQAMQIAARYIAPATGAVTGLDGIIYKSRDERIELAQRLWKATNQTLKNSAFLLELAFLIVTDVIRAKDHESSSTPVNIGNGAATVIILGCLTISLLGGMRIYFLEEEERRQELEELENPGLFKRVLRFISCNPVSSRVMAFLTGAAATHWLVSTIQNLIGSSTSTVARIIRYYLTAFGGLPAALLGYSLPGRPFIYHTQIYFVLLITQATALILDAYQKFNSPNSMNFWGFATIREQIYYWAIAFPTAIISIQFALLGWRWCINKANQASKSAPKAEEEIQLLLDSGSPRLTSDSPSVLRFTQSATKEIEVDPENKVTYRKNQFWRW